MQSCHWQWRWHQVMLAPMVSYAQNSHIAPDVNYLDQMNLVVKLATPLASCDNDVGANGHTWPKSHVAPHINCLDLMTVMVPLMTLLVSCDTDTGVNGITRPEMSWCTSFWNKNAVVSLMISSVSCDTNTSIAWPKRSCCTSVWPLSPKKQNGTVDNATSVMWDQCQQHHITKNVDVSYFFSCLELNTMFQLSWLMNRMVPLMMRLASHETKANTNGMPWLKSNVANFILIFVAEWMKWRHWQHHWHPTGMYRQVWTLWAIENTVILVWFPCWHR